MSFKRMDEGRPQEWMAIAQEVTKRQAKMPERIKSMLLQLEEQVDGFNINQLQHCLQTATRALRAGASEEVIVAALCHDIGKAISIENHPAIGAEILKAYVSHETYEIIRTHQDFQGRHYYALMGKNPNARSQYEKESWYESARQFTDEWDQVAFDHEYDTLPLSYFEPMIDRIFAQANSAMAQAAQSMTVDNASA